MIPLGVVDICAPFLEGIDDTPGNEWTRWDGKYGIYGKFNECESTFELQRTLAWLVRHEQLFTEFSQCMEGWRRFRIYTLPVGARINSMTKSSPECLRKKKLIFANINTSPEAFSGVGNIKPQSSPLGLLPNELEEISLKELYQCLPRPGPTPFWTGPSELCLGLNLMDVLWRSGPDGLSSTLYDYQKRTVWSIIQREQFPTSHVDPQLILMKSPCGMQYYIHEQSLDVYADPPRYSGVSGGIICEDMGTGKTIVCISVALYTRGLISSPPPYVSAYREDQCSTDESTKARNVPTLVEFAARRLLQKFSARRLAEALPDHLAKRMEAMQPPSYQEVLAPYRFEVRTPYSTTKVSPSIYLSSSTLVIVPDTLTRQWVSEINKHTDEGALKVLEIRNSDKIPPGVELIQFDIVIISMQRFGREERSLSFNLDIPCKCPYAGATRVIDCKCPTPSPEKRAPSPLLCVRWFRVIVDEGHSMARSQNTNNTTKLARKLNFDRVWACTGTPLPFVTQHVSRKEIEKQDLKAFEHLCCQFLRVEPYASTSGLFTNAIGKPFMNRSKFAVRRLQGLMETLMVRNQPDDVEREVQLPPLFQKVVQVPFTRHQRLIHNCLLALMAANIVLSERADQDYLFHKTNRKSLRYAVDNLHMSCFWYANSDVGKSRLQDALNNIREEGLDVSAARNFSSEDVQLLKNAEKYLLEALQDQTYLDFHEKFNNDLPYAISERNSRGPSGHDNCWPLENPTNELEQSMSAGKVFELRAKRAKEILEPETSQCENASRWSILASYSSKLNYIANEIIRYAVKGGEKLIIYGTSNAEIYYVDEFCRLAKIKCLLFHGMGMTNSERAQNLVTFNTSDVRVIIMDQRIASWGIDLSTASRVYFLSPVWRDAIRLQAIKRAHRIGCTRPVYVETMVVSGSFEEEMAAHMYPHARSDTSIPQVSEDEISSDEATPRKRRKSGTSSAVDSSPGKRRKTLSANPANSPTKATRPSGDKHVADSSRFRAIIHRCRFVSVEEENQEFETALPLM
ncbi:SNF2 family N-terminal domain-containing protein [Cladochytrium replicatum]|nr:SNF2 family N-terminal domain-containing protein [Cladochytrium replicatum]